MMIKNYIFGKEIKLKLKEENKIILILFKIKIIMKKIKIKKIIF